MKLRARMYVCSHRDVLIGKSQLWAMYCVCGQCECACVCMHVCEWIVDLCVLYRLRSLLSWFPTKWTKKKKKKSEVKWGIKHTRKLAMPFSVHMHRELLTITTTTEAPTTKRAHTKTAELKQNKWMWKEQRREQQNEKKQQHKHELAFVHCTNRKHQLRSLYSQTRRTLSV